MLEMKLILYALSIITITQAAPKVLSDERISAILDKLRQAHSIGELAVNTPNGIYPIKDINKSNIHRIFNFDPISRKYLDTNNAKEIVADNENISSTFINVPNTSSSNKPNELKNEEVEKSNEEGTQSSTELTMNLTTTTTAVTHTEDAVVDEINNDNLTIIETLDTNYTSHEVKNESIAENLTNISTTELLVATIDNEHEKTKDDATNTSLTETKTSNDVIQSIESSDKPLKREVKEEVEGSAELLEDTTEGSGDTNDLHTDPLQDQSSLLTNQPNGNSIVVDSADALLSTINKSHKDLEQASSPNPSLPAINLPQFPGMPYVFLPVKSIQGADLPVLSYLLVPKKYENELHNIFLTAKKV
ncbi:hypothetical protein DICVIV_11076 [Dictyocaulus viviparus]|uniref:Uncharacterized protein n=1 Tax=Dictyocaulus viviparus TaxID=29172 RepID=A0A0D8XGT0_DICVI|nr:hypothetical protein DICVIV_11076 [Dictyocaulus viviparus]